MMKKILGILISIGVLGIAGCSEPVIPSNEVNKLTLAFLNANIYPNAAVECEPAKIAERLYVGCYGMKLNGHSNISLWLYEEHIFKAVNGTARQFAESKFSDEAFVGVLPLPIPEDIKINEAIAVFKK